MLPLFNGNYVVNSPNWKNGAATTAGAITWGSGSAGIAGIISSGNSLVGSHTSDQIGSHGTFRLTNGNYVVVSPLWGIGTTNQLGAVTWGNGTTGITGTVGNSNSLVGSAYSDQVGSTLVTTLNNGNYVVNSPYWSNGSISQVGAATWVNGATGLSGPVSTGNSLVGSQTNDRVSFFGTTALTNGNYAVRSPDWANGVGYMYTNAGAVTWGNGTTGIVGAVSPSNSLVGTHGSDGVGAVVVALTNGNYVAGSSQWANGSITRAGAVTLCNSAGTTVGPVTTANSLTGSNTSDQVGEGITALTNGNYVAVTYYWANGPNIQAGAVTWCNGTTGLTGPVTTSNSLVGSTTNDYI